MAEDPTSPQPDPALRRLDRFVGRWSMEGNLVGSDEKNIKGETTFRWLPGGFFLEQHMQLNFMGLEIESLELIGYDPETETFPINRVLEPVTRPSALPVGGRGRLRNHHRVIRSVGRDLHRLVARRRHLRRRLAPEPGRRRDRELSLRHRRPPSCMSSIKSRMANERHERLVTERDAAAGPLVVSAANPRYFAIESDNGPDSPMVYLTGSHIWNNFHDGLGPGRDCADTPEQNDFGAYLEFLRRHGHNFIRLWRWEQFRSQAAGGSFHLCMTPQPWPRNGPGPATDGRPKFDLTTFDQAFFDRLRDRVIAAGNAGIYVAVMLFEGWGLHLSPAPDNVEGHPFHAANNVNGIGISSIVDYQVLPLDARVKALQEAYIRKVVDAVHDLPNVLYEVANESSGADAEVVQLPDGSSIPTPVGRLHAVAVLGDRLRQAVRAAEGIRRAPGRDDDAVSRPRPGQGE